MLVNQMSEWVLQWEMNYFYGKIMFASFELNRLIGLNSFPQQETLSVSKTYRMLKSTS